MTGAAVLDAQVQIQSEAQVVNVEDEIEKITTDWQQFFREKYKRVSDPLFSPP